MEKLAIVYEILEDGSKNKVHAFYFSDKQRLSATDQAINFVRDYIIPSVCKGRDNQEAHGSWWSTACGSGYEFSCSYREKTGDKDTRRGFKVVVE